MPAKKPKASQSKSVVSVPLVEIRPYWRNPRVNDEAVGFVVESIKRYGFAVPLVLDKENVIIAGHCRYRAAQQLRLKKIPCIIVDLNEQQASEYRIADNKTAEFALWDKEKLAQELQTLKDLSGLKELFLGPEWEALFAAGVPQVKSLKNPDTGEEEEETPQDVIVPCPHCGENNTFQVKGDTVEGALPAQDARGEALPEKEGKGGGRKRKQAVEPPTEETPKPRTRKRGGK